MQSPTPPKASAAMMIKYGFLLAVLMLMAALSWVGGLRGRHPLDEWFRASPSEALLDIVLGLFLGTIASVLGWVFGQRYAWFKGIRQRLVMMLDLKRYHWQHHVILALLAAIPEEIFFRGALQPVVGLWLGALIFGALHAMTPAYFVYASSAGLLLGLLANWHATLYLPIAAHFAVDLVTLSLLARWARTEASQTLPHLDLDGMEA